MSSNVASKYSIGVSASTGTASHLRKPKLSGEGVANACVRSTTRPKANRLRTTHPDEDVTEHRLRYHVGPHTCPRVDRARGARGPLTLRLAGTPRTLIERTTSQIGILREQTNRAGIWGIGDLIPAGLVLYSRRARSLFPQGCAFIPAGLCLYSRRTGALFPQGRHRGPGHSGPARRAPTAMAGIRVARHAGPGPRR